jgi:hypothetical protein
VQFIICSSLHSHKLFASDSNRNKQKHSVSYYFRFLPRHWNINQAQTAYSLYKPIAAGRVVQELLYERVANQVLNKCLIIIFTKYQRYPIGIINSPSAKLIALISRLSKYLNAVCVQSVNVHP